MFSKQALHDRIRTALVTRLARLEQDNEQIAARMANSSTAACADMADQADHELSNNLDLVQYERNNKAMGQIKRALKDMDHANYGQCKLCGDPIHIKRLLAMPHTTYCIQCQQTMDQGPSIAVNDGSWDATDMRF